MRVKSRKNLGFKAFVGSLEKGLSAEAIPRDSSWHLGELSNGFRSHGEWRRSTGPTAERVSVEIGFVLDLNGTHKPAANHVGRTCRHCTNLMLALKIIGDW